MREYVTKDGRQLRLGYTTGSCAAAAAKAAAWALLTGRERDRIGLLTPAGPELDLEVLDWKLDLDQARASCAIRKDSGDDPDVTQGSLIYAEVSLRSEVGIEIDGGQGVGRVTKPGLDQPVGAAAINSVPRQMIRENLQELCRSLDYRAGFRVLISVPEGETLAKKTFNSRLGIEGGISILGTSGIVEPMSEAAIIETIRLELKQRRVKGAKYALLTPGNYGKTYLTESLGFGPEVPVMVSNFIGDAFYAAKELGYRGALLVGHLGKLVKLAGGMLNTHSKYGDCRMQILGAEAGSLGLEPDQIRAVLAAATSDEAVRIIERAGLLTQTMAGLAQRIDQVLDHKWPDDFELGVISFSKAYGQLARTRKAQDLLVKIREEY